MIPKSSKVYLNKIYCLLGLSCHPLSSYRTTHYCLVAHSKCICLDVKWVCWRSHID